MNRYRRELSDRLLALRLSLGGRQHQYPEIRTLRRFIEAFDVDCIFDVGANQGQYATMLRRDVGFRGLILSFEPNPEVRAKLDRAARGDPRWQCLPYALSDADGPATFNIMTADQFSSLEAPEAALPQVFADRNRVARTVEVERRRLDGLFAELEARFDFRRPFLKMDTQGHDQAVCEGAAAVRERFLGIQSELAFRTLYAGSPGWREAMDYFEGLGFRPSAIVANNKGHFPLLVEMDCIFVNSALVKA